MSLFMSSGAIRTVTEGPESCCDEAQPRAATSANRTSACFMGRCTSALHSYRNDRQLRRDRLRSAAEPTHLQRHGRLAGTVRARIEGLARSGRGAGADDRDIVLPRVAAGPAA